MKKNKYIMTLILIIILLLSSIGMYIAYPSIHNNVSKSDQEYNITAYMSDKIFYSNYAISQELDKKAEENTSLDSYITAADNTSSRSYKYDFINSVQRRQTDLMSQNDFVFSAKNLKTGKTLSNTKEDILDIHSQPEIQKQYQWYVHIEFNSNGQITYQSNLRNQESIENQINSLFSNYNQDSNDYDYDVEDYVHVQTQLSNLKDISITYAVSQTIDSTSDLSLYLSNDSASDYMRFAVPYILGLCALVSIIIFIIPLQYLKEIKFLDITSRIKFGFLALFWCLIEGSLLTISPFMIRSIYSHELIDFYKTFGMENFSDILTPCIQIGFWFIFFTLIIVLTYMIKYLFHKGIKAYFKENTCLGWIFINSHKLINKVINIDLNDNINRSVLKIVIVNFFIITIISIFFVFGFFFAFIYSVIIFFLLKNKFTEIKQDYEVLLNATKRLSNGQFDVDIHEDVGIFNPLKKEFAHIKDGFEKAVKEEVKSQKMKTELISNVSHDLKTPLTSIITYVDLLKKDQLTDEERNQYIQVLERNSLRLKNLIDDLFEVSKANSGDIKLNYADVDIVSLIKQAELECQDKLDEKTLNIKMTTSDDKIIHSLDSSKTYRIFENLFINISKYALDHTRVYIDVIDAPEKITIIFKNISEQEITFNNKEIVERFVQGDKSRNTKGSGLGLAIVKSFTELQKGEFHVETDGDLFKSVIVFYK